MKKILNLISNLAGAEALLLFKNKKLIEKHSSKNIDFPGSAIDEINNLTGDGDFKIHKLPERLENIIDNGSLKYFAYSFRYRETEYSLFILTQKTRLTPQAKERLELAFELLADKLKSAAQAEKIPFPKRFFLPLFLYNIKRKEVTFATEGFENLLGFKARDFNKLKFKIFRNIKPEYFPKFKKFMSHVLEGENAYVDFEMKDFFGTERYLRIYSVTTNDKITIVSLLLDITNEKNLRERLENANFKFKKLLSISNDLIFSLNRSGYFMLVNEEGVATLGYHAKDLIGKHFLEIVAENDKPTVALAFQKILKSDDAISFDVKFIDSNGAEVPFKITATSLSGNDGISGMLGYGKNYSEIFNEKKKLKDLNEKLLETNRLLAIERDRATEQVTALEKLNELKNEFISNVSHELRTPLASIIGFSEAIAEDKEMSRDLITEFNQIILEEGKRLTKLIDAILDYSKLEDDKMEFHPQELNLIELLETIIDGYKSFAKKKNIKLISELPEAEFIINADRKLLDKAFSNIISNAIKFNKEGGEVKISIHNFLKEISVTISDTGIGIPQSELKTIFDKFKKIRKAGTYVPGAGLGLVIAKRIIDKHGGSINISSVENKGTTVIISLPKERRE